MLLDDADLVTAIRDGVGDAFFNTGQTCSALTRMLVPRSRLAEVEEIARQVAQEIVVVNLSDVRTDMSIAQDEIFGPVLSILPYDDEDEAVAIANDSVYGLAGGVWSADDERADRVARRLRVGMVRINGGDYGVGVPFGGYRQSGNGRENGVFGLEEFLEIKALLHPRSADVSA